MVREALGSAEPAAPKLQQRHTARRIFDRLRSELPDFSGSERTVHGYVLRRRQQLGLEYREVFIAQTCDWGSEPQVDRCEAWRF